MRNELEAAYRRAIYRVFLPHPPDGAPRALDLRIDEGSKALAAWLAARHAPGHWAILTACNPASARFTEAQNALRQKALAADLAALGLPFFPGENRDETGQWPMEPAFFIPGLARAEALRLAQKYGQNAFVQGLSGMPRLLWAAGLPVA
jgi:hypothetical protein